MRDGKRRWGQWVRWAAVVVSVMALVWAAPLSAQKKKKKKKPAPAKVKIDPELTKLRVSQKGSPAPKAAEPVATTLPLKLKAGDHVVFIGNTLFDRAQDFGYFETLLHQKFPTQKLHMRTLAWSADEVDNMPRPSNFGSLDQHLLVQKADVIFAAFGFNESFKGDKGLPLFKENLTKFLQSIKTKAYNGKTAAQIVLVSPIANEDVKGVPAGKINNASLAAYSKAMTEVAAKEKVGFVDVFASTKAAMASPDKKANLTFNGVHLSDSGYQMFASALYDGAIGETAPAVNAKLRAEVLEKNEQFHYRYRPVNSFYYVGGRSKRYGPVDFFPAMKRFDVMLQNRDKRVWAVAQGQSVSAKIDDSNAPPLPPGEQGRGINKWMTPADELKAFKVDPRFEVNCFASEEDFPELACPIQMRWDSKGRLWVSCSTTYPHVYPGNAPVDKIIILEDTDKDGKADKCSVFTDKAHIPLSFEFGGGGLYVSEQPHLTLLKDTNGDGKADFREKVVTGFGTEDSHHSLHDISWTPDGDLIARESVFHHSQIETPYGPQRLYNSGWFRYTPRNHRLITFGMYGSTNPWGVTFDDWGQHVASHPIFASAFHALNPPYPKAHPRPGGIKAYSGTAGQEFVDFPMWPKELQGGFIKARYKPTNRIEIHKWVENDDHYAEQHVGDLIFSTNLSFIPVDLRYGPRGAMYVCDWYNPVKGHAQYSLRDDRRDRKSGRIWRIVPKGAKLQEPPKIDGASLEALLDILKRPEYRYRYWAKREIRAMDPAKVKAALDTWVKALDTKASRFRHHQVEAIWTYRNVGAKNIDLLREVLACENHHARAAATRQLRYWHVDMPDAEQLLLKAAKDLKGLVRLEAVIAASYIGTEKAFEAVLIATKYPRQAHLSYAIACSLGSANIQRHWVGKSQFTHVPAFIKNFNKKQQFVETTSNASSAQWDGQKNLAIVKISCVPEKIKFTVERFEVKAGQPIKLIFINPDATDHNLVICLPGTDQAVGMAANEMAKDPKFAKSDFIPSSQRKNIVQATRMIGPLRKSKIHVLRFKAPTKKGIYPYVCTFPGHWVIMKGQMIVK